MSTEHALPELEHLVERLRDPARYPHPVETVDLVETHISWVLLAGAFAYKLKKPLDLGFLDFSTLERRRVSCDEELRLNRRLAADLYLDVVPVTGTLEDPRIGGEGPALEYAVKMRRFRREDELDVLAKRGALATAHIDELARVVARFHGEVAVAPPGGPWGTPERALAPCLENFRQLERLDHDPADRAQMERIRAWTLDAHARLEPTFARRLAGGFVRECHGDLHLANIVLVGGRITVFDAIEFNPALRWTDVMAEIAFTVMDLRHRGRVDLAQRFLNRYLEETGDYAGLAVLPFYLVYRAMVRAKVAGIRARQEDAEPAHREASAADLRAHLGLAEAFAAPRAPMLVVAHGLSGSGKSYTASRVVERGDWIRVRSDVERKRLAGLEPLERSGSGVGAGLYTPEMTGRTYARLAELARAVLDAGYPLIVDAAFLERTRRETFRAIAREHGVPFAILAAEAPEPVLRERVAAREAAGADASEATLTVLEGQFARREPLDAAEAAVAVRVETSGAIDANATQRALTRIASRS